MTPIDRIKGDLYTHCTRERPDRLARYKRLDLDSVRMDGSRLTERGGVLVIHGTKAQWRAIRSMLRWKWSGLLTVEWAPISRREAAQTRQFARYIEAVAQAISDKLERQWVERVIALDRKYASR